MTKFARFLAIVLAALLAGVSFGIWLGFNPMHLDAVSYMAQQQHMVTALKALMVGLVVAASVITILAAVLQRRHKTRFLLLIAAAFFLVSCIFITRFGNKPIDDSILTWTSQTIPSNWQEMRSDWWQYHTWRTMVEIAALLLIAWANVIPEPKQK